MMKISQKLIDLCKTGNTLSLLTVLEMLNPFTANPIKALHFVILV